MVTVMDLAKIFDISPKQPLCVLSPHLDDAIWSLGAVLRLLTSAGYPVQVITIFSDTTQTPVRKMEDSKALASAGCTATLLDFPDAILDGRSLANVFDEAYKPPASKVEDIANQVQEILPAGATVLAPSGFGVHVDHLTTRAVATKLNTNILYYEDLPYAARDVRLANAQSFLNSLGLQRHPIAATPELIDEHLRLYNMYESQRQDHHVQQIRTYLSRTGFGIWR